MTGVAIVALVLELAAREHHLVGVDDHNVVAGVDVRGVIRAVLAAETRGDVRSQATNNGPFGVNHDPLFLDVRGLGGKGLHRSALVSVFTRQGPSLSRRWAASTRARQSRQHLL